MALARARLTPDDVQRRKAFVRQLTREAYDTGMAAGFAEAVAAAESEAASGDPGEGLAGMNRLIDPDTEVRWGMAVNYELQPTGEVPPPPPAREPRIVSVQQERGRAWLLHWVVTCPGLLVGDIFTAVFRIHAGTGSANLTWDIRVPVVATELRGTAVIPFARLDVDPEVPESIFVFGADPRIVSMGAGVTPIIPGGD